MTTFDPGWDDETPDEPEPPAPVMAIPEVILLDDADAEAPDWAHDGPHWKSL